MASPGLVDMDGSFRVLKVSDRAPLYFRQAYSSFRENWERILEKGKREHNLERILENRRREYILKLKRKQQAYVLYHTLLCRKIERPVFIVGKSHPDKDPDLNEELNTHEVDPELRAKSQKDKDPDLNEELNTHEVGPELTAKSNQDKDPDKNEELQYALDSLFCVFALYVFALQWLFKLVFSSYDQILIQNYYLMVILMANDIEINPGPFFDLSIQYVNYYLQDKDYDSRIIKEHVDQLLKVQSIGQSIPKEYITDENILLWTKVKFKAKEDEAFDDDFCDKVHSIWSYWSNQAFNQEFPNANEIPPTPTINRNHENTDDIQNITIPLTNQEGQACGVFKYQRKDNSFICLGDGCKKKKKPMKNRETLKNHARKDHFVKIDLLTKTGQKTEPFKCKCGKSFSRKQTLRDHQGRCQDVIHGAISAALPVTDKDVMNYSDQISDASPQQHLIQEDRRSQVDHVDILQEFFIIPDSTDMTPSQQQMELSDTSLHRDNTSTNYIEDNISPSRNIPIQLQNGTSLQTLPGSPGPLFSFPPISVLNQFNEISF